MASPVSPSQNPPLTAAGLTAVVMALLAAFTNMSADQIAALGSAVGLVAAYVAQRFTEPKGVAS